MKFIEKNAKIMSELRIFPKELPSGPVLLVRPEHPRTDIVMEATAHSAALGTMGESFLKSWQELCMEASRVLAADGGCCRGTCPLRQHAKKRTDSQNMNATGKRLFGEWVDA
jgi:hypothetical protein